MSMFRSIFLFSIFFSFSFAQTNTSETEQNYIDKTHKKVSHKAIEWSGDLDSILSEWIGEDDGNVTTEVEEKETVSPLNKRVKSVDSFFQNKKYLDETDETFVSLRLDGDFQSRDPDEFKMKLGGQIALSKSKKRFKFFIDNATSDNVDDILEDDASSAPEIGLHYFAPEQYGIESKYSLGTKGIDPFVRARYNITFQVGSWYIEPSQKFQYSVLDKFEEETNIYFDRHFENLSLFRFLMHRKTQEKKEGMDYAFNFQYYWSPIENLGLRLSQSFLGNTKYPYIINPNIEPPITENYSAIYDYESSFAFRHNVWRKWFFYEVRPGVSFHKDHDFEPNYLLRVFLDFHFGHFY